MSVKISDLLPQPREVKTGKGDASFGVNALTMEQITWLINKHREDVLYLLAIAQAPEKNFAPFLTQAPVVVANIIAMAAGVDLTDTTEIEAIRKLSGVVQLMALSEIWEATIPDQKKFSQLLAKLTSLTQKQKSDALLGTGNIATLPQKNAASSG